MRDIFTESSINLFEQLLNNFSLSAKDENFATLAQIIINAKTELQQYRRFQQLPKPSAAPSEAPKAQERAQEASQEEVGMERAPVAATSQNASNEAKEPTP